MRLIVLLMLACIGTSAQTSFRDVKIFAMDSKEAKNTTDTLGESIVTLIHHPKTIDDLTRRDIKMLKKAALKNQADAVSVDLKRLWTNNDMHRDNEYYILYLKNK